MYVELRGKPAFSLLRRQPINTRLWPFIVHADYVKGFGGKFGVQTDRQDKCALGWDHQEKLHLHESQKGTFTLAARPRGPLGGSSLFTGPRVPGLAVLVSQCCPVFSGGGGPLSPRLWKDPSASSDSPFPLGGLRLGGAGRLCSPGP